MTTLLAYGSLCSGLGLQGLGQVAAERVERVRLRNCRRGFGKLSQYGNRYAMVLEPLRGDEPIRVEVGTGPQAAGAVDALALTVAAQDLGRISSREGYDPEVLRRLALAAEQQGLTVSRWLWRILESVGFRTAPYRRLLFERTGYTSPHYIPHPVAWSGEEPALTFLPPGAEGSGSDSVIPVRVATGVLDVLSVAAAWRRKSNASQIEYFAMCLLGEAHGLSFADVLSDLEPDSTLAEILRERLRAEIEQEPARFRATFGLSAQRYDNLRGNCSPASSLLGALEQDS